MSSHRSARIAPTGHRGTVLHTDCLTVQIMEALPAGHHGSPPPDDFLHGPSTSASPVLHELEASTHHMAP
ncbi:hypothetical protein U9M48_003926 [Paspalum notatum var. saurae]|uniref:Uncharacterized protein n=1 Tax=Paspalum notatum var. saurae TaxID=547442 RepID=A0AAQ3PTY5_PASNO